MQGKLYLLGHPCLSISLSQQPGTAIRDIYMYIYISQVSPWEDLYLLHVKDLTQNEPEINVKTSLDQTLQSFPV